MERQTDRQTDREEKTNLHFLKLATQREAQNKVTNKTSTSLTNHLYPALPKTKIGVASYLAAVNQLLKTHLNKFRMNVIKLQKERQILDWEPVRRFRDSAHKLIRSPAHIMISKNNNGME